MRLSSGAGTIWQDSDTNRCPEPFHNTRSGLYKVPHSPLLEVMTRGKEYHGCGEEYNMEKRERGIDDLPYKLRLLGRILSGERGRGRKIREENQG